MTPKEKYEKPELQVIELRADEVLAANCKVVGVNAPGRPNCGAPPPGPPCTATNQS